MDHVRVTMEVLTLKVPSTNQCLHSLNAFKLERDVKIIIDSSSNRMKFSPRSVCFNAAGNWLFKSNGSGTRCRRMVCDKACVEGKSATILTGTVRKTFCRMILVGSSEEAPRSFNWFWIRINISLFGLGACEWSDGICRNDSIVEFVWQRPAAVLGKLETWIIFYLLLQSRLSHRKIRFFSHDRCWLYTNPSW